MPVEPDRQPTPRLDPPRRPRRTRGAGRGCGASTPIEKTTSKRRLGQRQVEQVGLDDRHVGQPGAERGGLLDGRAEIDADDPRPVPPTQAGIPTAAAAGVEHQPARPALAGSMPRLDPERRLVLLGPHDVIAVPLPAEAGDVGIAREPGNRSDDREPPGAGPAGQLPRRVAFDLQIALAPRTSDQ